VPQGSAGDHSDTPRAHILNRRTEHPLDRDLTAVVRTSPCPAEPRGLTDGDSGAPDERLRTEPGEEPLRDHRALLAGADLEPERPLLGDALGPAPARCYCRRSSSQRSIRRLRSMTCRAVSSNSRCRAASASRLLHRPGSAAHECPLQEIVGRHQSHHHQDSSGAEVRPAVTLISLRAHAHQIPVLHADEIPNYAFPGRQLCDPGRAWRRP